MDAQGALDSLLGRLTTVLVSEGQLLGGVRGDVEFIKDEMESMNGLLLHLTEAQHRDHQVRAWMKQIAGLTRDCGGNVELYVHYVGGAPRGITGYLRRVPRFVRTIPIRHRIATRIRELKVRARDVGDRRLRYGVTVPPALAEHQDISISTDDTPGPQPGGPEEEEDLRRRELLHGEPPDTVEEGTKRVLEWLLEPPMGRRSFKLFPIVGRGSVGKTSIAKKVYEHSSMVSSFPHRVWINFGGLHKDHNVVCQEILQQLAPLQTGTGNGRRRMVDVLEAWLQQRADRQVRGDWFLLIVLDALPFGGLNYSVDQLFESLPLVAITAVIVTGRGSSRSYGSSLAEIKSLNVHDDFDSHPRFFRRRALELSKRECAPMMQEVLEECYPDAFAQRMFLHLLYVNPNRSDAEMSRLAKALQDHKDSTSKVMLMFCYMDLPIRYKSCLSYVSIFPQDHIIRRTTLVRRWLAEGLVTERRSKGSSSSMHVLDDQAERIFDALVARGFLRPNETSAAGKIKTCTIHHTVHDFISTDVSFMDASLTPDLAHRFSINSGIALEEEASPSVRPFHAILHLLESLPGSPQWQLLKVLDLQGCRGLTKKHLKNICKILLLKYLSLRDTDVTELPKEVDKLQCLETLDIRQTQVSTFATKSVVFPMLKHLLAGNKVSPSNSSDRPTVRLPSGVRRMKKLEILSHVDASENVDDLVDFGQLLHLRKLGVILHGKKTGGLSLLFQQIEKLHGCLRSLSIQINQSATSDDIVPDTEQVAHLVTPPKLLRSLNISGITSRLPHWIAELTQLTEITLSKISLGEDDICTLGKLSILSCLKLRHMSCTGTKLSFKAVEFQHLKSLVIEGSGITNISFDNRAAPKLEMIVWSFASMEALSGLNHLPKLNKLELNGDCDPDPVRQAMEAHPNRPAFQHNLHHQSQEAGTAVTAPTP